RFETKAWEQTHGPKVEEFREAVKSELANIDEKVREPPVPPRQFGQFFGDSNQPDLYHTGEASDPIPIVFSKSEDDYQPIQAGGKTYTYPNGPEVRGRNAEYDLKVHSKYQYKEGKLLKNVKGAGAETSRETQVDINFALQQSGVNMKGLDGDHVQDLG